MVQALKSGELDYAHDVNPDQFKALAADPAYTAVAGKANGWTQLAFNTYGTGTGKTIQGGGPSTKALLDPAFRDALGYAVDHKALVDRVLGGYGDPGTTIVPPILTDWHVEPDQPRTLQHRDGQAEARRGRLSARRERQPARQGGQADQPPAVHPNSNASYAKSAQFIKDWYGQLGIERQRPGHGQRRAQRPHPAAGGRQGPPSTTSSSGAGPATRTRTRCSRSSAATRSAEPSDSQYCNPEYDKLYDQQLTRSRARSATRRWPRCRT